MTRAKLHDLFLTVLFTLSYLYFQEKNNNSKTHDCLKSGDSYNNFKTLTFDDDSFICCYKNPTNSNLIGRPFKTNSMLKGDRARVK